MTAASAWWTDGDDDETQEVAASPAMADEVSVDAMMIRIRFFFIFFLYLKYK